MKHTPRPISLILSLAVALSSVPPAAAAVAAPRVQLSPVAAVQASRVSPAAASAHSAALAAPAAALSAAPVTAAPVSAAASAAMGVARWLGLQAEPAAAVQSLGAAFQARQQPDPEDYDGLNDWAGRAFDNLSERDALSALVHEPLLGEGIAATAVRRRAPRQREELPPGDDGGGADYPRRKVAFNGHDFPSVAFRPNVPVDALLVQAIDASRESIRLSLYEFNSIGVMKALFAAKKRGVKIELILDDSVVNPRNGPGSTYERHRTEQIWTLLRNGFDVRVIGRPTEYGISHHKFAIFDDKMVEFGSYNYTYTSERNHYENVLFSNEKARVQAYKQAWEQQRAISKSMYDDKGKHYDESVRFEFPLDVATPPFDSALSVKFNGEGFPAWIFTPNEAFEDYVVKAIDKSETSVEAAAFVLESRKIHDAMLRALRRGVKVRVVHDESQTKDDDPSRVRNALLFLGSLQKAGAQVRLLGGPNGEDSTFPLAEKMHNKFFIFDGKLVETGSANATKNASVNNYENANFIDDATDVKAFVFAFKHMLSQGKALGKVPAGELPTDQQLRENALKLRGPPVAGEKPYAPLPQAAEVRFNEQTFPSSALLPHEPILPNVIKAVDSAKSKIRLAAYEFGSQPLLEALRRARERGVAVEIALDRGHAYTSGRDDWGEPKKPKPQIVDLIHEGFDVLLVKGLKGGIQHNKFVIVDDGFVQFGSYNYTDQSEYDHFESAVFTTEKARVDGYIGKFQHMRDNGEEVDRARLEEILARTSESAPLSRMAPSADEEEPDEDGEALPDDQAGRPPQDAKLVLPFNGEMFPLQLFSPNAGIEQTLIKAIRAAKSTIDIAMFSFYSQPIAEALLAAHRGGVTVRVVLERSQARSRMDRFFAWHGIDARVMRGPNDQRDPRYQKMHHKFAIFDGKLLEMGSFNFSSRADLMSYENANFFVDPKEIARFSAAFAQMFARANTVPKPKKQPVFRHPTAPKSALGRVVDALGLQSLGGIFKRTEPVLLGDPGGDWRHEVYGYGPDRE